jgi:hypothetical protein
MWGEFYRLKIQLEIQPVKIHPDFDGFVAALNSNHVHAFLPPPN